MTILSTLSKRSLGLHRSNRQHGNQMDLSNVIESFECLRTDEYVIVGHEDGSMVPPIACQFCKIKSSSNIAALVDENGYVVLYDTNKTGPSAQVKEWQAHNNAVFDLSWMADEEKLVTASGDQSAILWDVTRGENLAVFRGHTSSVRTVAFKPEDKDVFATGSRDGSIMIWDKRCSKTKDGNMAPINTIRNAHLHKNQTNQKARRKTKLAPPLDNHQSVIAIVFQSDMSLLSAGAGDGCVKVWDMRKSYNFVMADPIAKHQLQYGGSSCSKYGFTSLALDSTNSRLFVNCMDDVIYQYDVASLNPMPVSQYKGHRNSSFYVKASVSPDNQFLLSGSCDEMAYIWQIKKPNQSPVALKGHRAEVSDVAWSPADLTKIITLSDDNTMRIWRLNRRLSSLGSEVTPGLEVTGTAERTHREIGVSADSTGKSPALSRTTSLPITHITPNKPYPLKKIVTEGNSPRSTSPSITQWLGLSCKKAISDVDRTPKSGTANRKDHGDSMNRTPQVKSQQCGNNSRVRPCKRKLVSDDSEENPSKRSNILQDLPSSPLKCSNTSLAVKSFSHSAAVSVFSPKKCPNSPRKLDIDAHFGRPQTCCSPRKLIISNKSPYHGDTAPGALNFPSPTVDLPNFVMSGEISRINVKCKLGKENSPKKAPEMDWLTKLRLQKFGEGRDEQKILPKRNLFDRHTVSPLRRSSVASPGCSQGSDTASQGNSETDQKARTPSRGMKPLHNYFQRQNSSQVNPGG